jgi:hypothetical protein
MRVLTTQPRSVGDSDTCVPLAAILPRPLHHPRCPARAAYTFLAFHGHPFSLAQVSSSTDLAKSSTSSFTAARLRTRARELGEPQHRVPTRLPDPPEQRARGGVQQRQHLCVENVDKVLQQPPKQLGVGEGGGSAETPPEAHVEPAGGVGGASRHSHEGNDEWS